MKAQKNQPHTTISLATAQTIKIGNGTDKYFTYLTLKNEFRTVTVTMNPYEVKALIQSLGGLSPGITRRT